MGDEEDQGEYKTGGLRDWEDGRTKGLGRLRDWRTEKRKVKSEK